MVWQCAMRLADRVYDISEDWPKAEQFGMTSQVRRAAVSIPANIAEGQGRSGRKEFRHHVSIAYGSLCELETILTLARMRGYCDEAGEQALQASAGEVARLLKGLMRSLDAQSVNKAGNSDV
jgi:four helix bundle protein